MDENYVIVSDDEPGLAWSNEGGWVYGEHTVFSARQKKSFGLPIGGRWLPRDAYDTRSSYHVRVTGQPSDPEDDGVSGVYLVDLACYLPEHRRADAVLDGFHENVGISVLDDFRIEVVDEEGNVLQQSEDHDNYSLSEFAEFHGKVDMVPEEEAAPPSP